MGFSLFFLSRYVNNPGIICDVVNLLIAHGFAEDGLGGGEAG